MSQSAEKVDTFHGIEWFWNLGSEPIRFTVIQTTFGKARKYFKPIQFDVKTGVGVQRRLIDKWVNRLKNEMSKGKYTPCPAHATIEKIHFDKKIIQIHHRKIKITGSLEHPISLTDSQHRFAALEKLRNENFRLKDKVDQLPVVIQVSLNTDPVQDFINLQKGRPTDKTHVLSMKITKGLVEGNKENIYKNALKIADLLNTIKESPFYNQIKMETNSVGCIPLSSLIAENPSDISTSLLAAGRILQLTNRSPESIAQTIVDTHHMMMKNSPELFEEHKLLCLPPKGTKGAATIIVGISCLVSYAEHHFGTSDFFADDDRVEHFLECCEEIFKRNANNNLSGPSKRQIMGEFAKALYQEIPDEICHEGIPKELLTLLATSAYNVSALPKTKSAPRKKKKKEIVAQTMLAEPKLNNEDDIDVNSFFDEDTDEDDGFF